MGVPLGVNSHSSGNRISRPPNRRLAFGGALQPPTVSSVTNNMEGSMKIEASLLQRLIWGWRWLWAYDREAMYLSFREYVGQRTWRYQTAKSNGGVLTEERDSVTARRARCNHRKGGMISFTDKAKLQHGLDNGGASQYSVIKHQLSNGDWWIRCTRCGMTWTKGMPGYKEAIHFETRNVYSSSVQVRFNNPEDEATFRNLTAASGQCH
jgi:hypothetical protein